MPNEPYTNVSTIVVWGSAVPRNTNLQSARDHFRSVHGILPHEFWDTTWLYAQEAGPGSTSLENSWAGLNVSDDGSLEATNILEISQSMGYIVSEAMGVGMENYIVNTPAINNASLISGLPSSMTVGQLRTILDTMTFKIVKDSTEYGKDRGGANVNGKVEVTAKTVGGYIRSYWNEDRPGAESYTGGAYLYLHELAHSSPAGAAVQAYYDAQYRTAHPNEGPGTYYMHYNFPDPSFTEHERAIHEIARSIGDVIGILVPETPPWEPQP